MNKQKRIAVIHDISCVGKCSLTVALPLLSCAGFESCPLPTALLSTHTGDFDGYTFLDLTDEMLPITNHWKKLGLTFDAIYPGYLGSPLQLNYTEKFINNFGENSLVLIDPVMGDHGRLYSGFNMSFVGGMAHLCRKAHVLVPNLTEACFLTNTPYPGEIQTKEFVEDLALKLTHICSGKIVLKGISFDEDKIGVLIYENGEISYVFGEKLNLMYHGTGDVFASTLLVALLKDFSLQKSAEIAVNFVIECMLKTKECVGDKHYGVNFELCTGKLLEMLDVK